MGYIETAVANWKRSCEAAALDKHPALWVGHFNPKLLGTTSTPKITAELVLMLGSPFATSDISATYIICDRLGYLSISGLWWDRGVWDAHWIAPYTRHDDGTIGFSFAVKEPNPDLEVAKAVGALGEHRLRGAQYDFDIAFGYSVEAAEELL